MAIPGFPSLLGLAFPVGRAPSWRTIKQEAMSGKETRLQLWTYPRYKYEIPVAYLGANQQNQDWQTLSGFFNSVGGAALPWHWNDPYDRAVTNQALGSGNGTQTVFGFVRTLGGFAEPVQDATAGSITISLNGAAQSPSSYTLLADPNWSLVYAVAFASAPASGVAVSWSGAYQWPCRFDEDSAQLSNFMFNFWELKKIGFETVKVL